MKTRLVLILFFVIIFLAAVHPIINSQYIHLMHDQVQAERVYEMARALAFGQFPVRFVQNLGFGYGYPLFNYYAPLPYYFAAAGMFLGLNVIYATKIMMIFGFCLAGVSMFLLGKRIWGTTGGLLSATLYTLAPYHAVQLYVRGSIGEMYALGLLPLIILGIYELWRSDHKGSYIKAGMIAVACLILSHTVSIIMFFSLLVPYLILVSGIALNKKDSSLLIKHVAFFAIPIALTAFFWLPAIAELKYIQLSTNSGNNVDYKLHFKTLMQLWNSPWGYGGSAPTPDKDGMSFMIGKISLILASVTLFLFGLKVYKKKSIHKLNGESLLIFLGMFLISIWLITSSSSFLWKSIPFFQLIQFPWRFLVYATLFVSLIAGGTLTFAPHMRIASPRVKFVAILFIAYFLLYPLNPGTLKTKFFNPQGDYKLSTSQITDQTHLRYQASKISSEYMSKDARTPRTKDEVSTDGMTCFSQCIIKDIQFTPTKYSFSANMTRTANIFLEKNYFPEFVATIDGKKEKIAIGVNNVLGVMVPQGSHKITLELVDTPLRLFANTISLISLALVIFNKQIYKKLPFYVKQRFQVP
jgi:hypothetical protein